VTAVERDILSYCRICAAACGITVTVAGDRVLRVRGDSEHPTSRGYTCSKARGLPDWHHAPSRLDRPRLRGVEVGWVDLLDDLATVVQSTIDSSGTDAVAMYLATGLAYDACGQVAAGSWIGSIGSRSFYSAATVDNAPVLVAAELVAGHAMLSPVWDSTSGGLLLLVGTNPVISHGYGTTLPDPVRHLRDHQERGGRIWVVDPRRTETAALADEHLAVRPGADVAVLAAVASALLVDGFDTIEVTECCPPDQVAALRRALAPFTVARAAEVAAVDPTAIERLIADVRGHPGRLAVMCGTGTTMATDGIVVEWLRWVVLILSGSLDRAGGMRFQHGVTGKLRPPGEVRPSGPGPASRPELPRVVQQVPAVALVDEIEAGNVRVLVVTGGNPISAIPEPDRMRAALASLDALVVIDVAESELVGLASHVLPATGQLERADVTLASHLSVRSAVQSTGPVVSPVADRRPVWWMLGSLSLRLGGDLLGGADPDSLTDELYLGGLLARSSLDADEVLAAGPRGIEVPIELGWVRDTMLVGGRWQIAPSVLLDRLAAHVDPGPGLVLTPRREMAWSNSVRYAGGRRSEGDGPIVRLHPADAAAAGVTDLTSVTVTSAFGEVTASVLIDANVAEGVVSMTHGRAGHYTGALTSTRVGVDPLTAMPRGSGVPVTIRPASANEVASEP
jgi:anaerobic selenocysteine-containing dehydrogenase